MLFKGVIIKSTEQLIGFIKVFKRTLKLYIISMVGFLSVQKQTGRYNSHTYYLLQIRTDVSQFEGNEAMTIPGTLDQDTLDQCAKVSNA